MLVLGARGWVRWLIVVLLGQFDGEGSFGAELDPQPLAGGGDGEVAVAQAGDEVEGLAGRLLVGEPEGVAGDVQLDRGADLGRRAEEPVGGDEPLERLVRALKIVRIDEQAEAALQIRKISEDGAGQKLLPQGFPEPLDFPAGLRVLGPALDVPDPLAPELLLELGRAAPGGVLPPLVAEDLARRAVRRETAAQGLHDQGGALVVRERV